MMQQQYGWRGGPPQMRGGGMFGRGGFSGGFRGARGGGGGGGGGGGPPRRDRSRSPLRSKKGASGEPSDWELRTDVILDFYNSDLNLCIDDKGVSAKPMNQEGFAYMWAGARSTYGVKAPTSKDALPFRVWYEVRVGEKLNVAHLPPEESNPHVMRVGWSVDASSLCLGEEPKSWGYGGTAKKSSNCKFENYGVTFTTGDVVGCFLEFEPGMMVRMAFTVNGQQQGNAYRFPVREIGDDALFPHVYTKNLNFEINFGNLEKPWFPAPEMSPKWTLIEKLPVEQRVRGKCPPEKIEDCEIIMMCGLPGAGKSYWVDKQLQITPDKRYCVLGSNSILDKMRVMGLPRKRNYHGRWDVLIEMAMKCLNKFFDIAPRRKRNYILDQTNVYPNAQRRKMRHFETFHRKAVVVVPTEEEFQRRVDLRTKSEGKEVPEASVMEMKANFRLPAEKDIFEEITFTELDRTAAEAMVKQYNMQGTAFKKAPPAPGATNPLTEPTGPKFRPDRNYGAPPPTAVETKDTSPSRFGSTPSSVRSFGDNASSDFGGNRGNWRGGGRGNFRGGFFGGDRRDNKPPMGRDSAEPASQGPMSSGRRESGNSGGFNDPEKGGSGMNRGGGRGGFARRGGGFQSDSGRRGFGGDDMGESGGTGFRGGRGGGFQGRGGFGSHRGGFNVERDSFGGNGGGRERGSDEFGGDRRGPSGDRSFGGSFGGDRGRGGFQRNEGPGGYSGSERHRPGFQEQPDSDRGMESFGANRGGNEDGDRFGGGQNFGFDRRGGYMPSRGRGGFGGDRGGFGADRGGFRGDRGGFGGDRGGFGGDRGGFGGDRGNFNNSRGGFGGDRFGGGSDFVGEQNNTYGEDAGRRSGGYGESGGNSGFQDRPGSSRFGDRGESSAGFGPNRGAGDDRGPGGYGSERSGGFGRDRGGVGGSGSGFGGERPNWGNFGERPERRHGFDDGRADRGGGSGFDGDRRGFGGRPGGSGGYSQRGRSFGDDSGPGSDFGSDRGAGSSFGQREDFSDGRNQGGYRGSGFGDSKAYDQSGSNSRSAKPRVSRWSDAEPSAPSVPPTGLESNIPGKGMSGLSNVGSAMKSHMKGQGFGHNQGMDAYDMGGQSQHQSPGGYHRNTADSSTAYNTNTAVYDTSYQQDYSAGYQSQAQPHSSAAPTQAASSSYSYEQESSSSYGHPYSQPPPQLPQANYSNYQQAGYGNSASQDPGYSSANVSWSQPADPAGGWSGSVSQQQQLQQQLQQPQQQQQQQPPPPPQPPQPPQQPPQQQQQWQQQQWQQPPPTGGNDQWSYYQQAASQHDWQQ